MEGRFKKLNILLGWLLFCLTFLIFVPAKVYGAVGVPKILNHQGRLFDASENPLGGTGTDFCFKFSIYDNATVGLGTKLWPTGTTSVMTINVKSGVFNVGIGDTSAGGDALNYNFQDNDTIFLNVEVANQSGGSCVGVTFETLSPRQRIFASSYAINADTIAGFHAAQSATSNQIPVLTSGNLILGAVNPQINATSSNVLSIQSNAASGNLLLNSLSGNVGIGTLTPGAKLEVSGGSGTSIRLTDTAVADASWEFLAQTGNTTKLFRVHNVSAYTDPLVINNSGNVGIGTTTPTALLTVGDVNSSLTTQVTGDLRVGNWGGTGISYIQARDSTAGSIDMQLRSQLNGSVVDVMRLTSGGNVGIGTTTPKEKIHLADGNFLQDGPVSPKVIGGANLSLPGGGLQLSFVSGRYIYAIFDNAAGTNILRIIDATDPANPAVVGGSALSLPGFPRSIYVAGRYAYMVFRNIAGTDIFRIVDISNPANPAVVGGSALSLPANGQHVFVSGRYAYATFDNGAGAATFRVIDISNPANPTVVGGSALSLPTSPRQIYVAGRYAYLAFYSSVNTDAFRIIDISDPKNPTVAGGASLALGFSTWSVFVSGRYAYLGFANSTGGQIFRVIDISNPTSPSIAGGSALDSVLPGFAKSVFVSGRYAYATFDNTVGTSTFRIIDVANPANPTVVGGSALSLPGFPRSVFVNGHYAYMVFFQGAGTDTIRVIDISGLEAVSALIHSLEAGSLQVSANAQIQNQLAVGGGINIDGGGLFASGGIGINGESLFTPLLDSTTTFRVQNAAGSETLFTADTTNNRIKIGDDDTAGNPATLLVVDTKVDAGDPAGTNGATYYNTSAQKFRCFENGVWKDCAVSFDGYALLRDAVGVTMTNAAAGGTEITNLVSRRTVDLTGRTNVRGQFAHSLNSATVKLRLDFSTDNCGTWNATPLVASFGAAVGANNNQTTAFAAIPAAAKTSVCVRAVIIGDGVLDPIVTHVDMDIN